MLSANGFALSGSYGSVYSSSPSVEPTYLLPTPSGTLVDGNLMLSVPLLNGGRLSAGTRSARSMQRAALQDVREARADSALRAAEAYLKALLATENVKAAEARAAAAEELVHTTQALYESGKGIQASVQRAAAELSKSQRMIRAAEGDRTKALIELRSETDLELDADLALTDVLQINGTVPDLGSSLKLALLNRGQVLRARARLESAQADVAAAEGLGQPQLYGVAMADAASQAGNRGISAGLTLSFPLYDGGERRAEFSKARAARDAAAAALHLAEIAVVAEVREAYVDLDTANAELASARETLHSAEEASEVAALRVANGKAVPLEQLDALQALSEARTDIASALFAGRLAQERVLRASGSLVEETPAR